MILLKDLAMTAIAVLLISACAREIIPEKVVAEPASSCENDPGLIPGSIIVKFTTETADALNGIMKADAATKSTLMSILPGTKAESLIPSMELLGIERIEREFPDAGEFEERHRRYGLHQWYHIFYCDTIPQTKATVQFETVPDVEMVVESRKVQPENVKVPFNDPNASTYQWYLNNDGSVGSGFLPGCDIDVVPAWSNYTAGTSDVIVAVIDYGVQINHPDLQGVVLAAQNGGSRNFIYGETDPFKVYPENHGTHVGSTIGAINNNGIGVCGIAGGKDGKGGVRIMSCNFFRSNPSSPGSTISGSSPQALVYAADNGAVIANNSWSYVYDSESSVPSNSSASLILIHTAIDYFIENAGKKVTGEQTGPIKGGLVFFSAGNNGWGKNQPAMYDNVIAVGACGPAFERASYSNYGDWVDVCAPGGNHSRFGTNSQIYACNASSSYQFMQGTSMACPVASGVAALLISYFGGPGVTADDIKTKLMNGANSKVKSYQDNPIGPLVDAYASLTQSSEPIPQVKGLSGESDESSITLSWTVGSYANGPVPQYTVAICNNKALIDFLKQTKIPATVTTKNVSTANMKAGDTASVTFEGLNQGTNYYCVAWGTDARGVKYGTISNSVTVKTKSNSAPVLSSDTEGPIQLKWNGTAKVVVTVRDDENDTWNWNTDAGSEAGAWAKVQDDVWEFSIDAAKAAPGEYTAKISVEDHGGLTDELTISYTIEPNCAPEATGTIDDTVADFNAIISILDLGALFQDGDGDELTYSTTCDGNYASATTDGSTLNVSTGTKIGISTVTVTATDPAGSSASISFRIVVCDITLAADLYPIPVRTNLNIRPRSEADVRIKVSSPQGVTLKESSVHADPFNPGSFDMSKFAPGVYTVTVTYENKTLIRKITKI